MDKTVLFQYIDLDDTIEVDPNDLFFHATDNGSPATGIAGTANILQFLLIKSNDSSEKVALTAFQWLFEVIIADVTTLTDRILHGLSVGNCADRSLSIIHLIAKTNYATILNLVFFRVMIAKCGIQTKEFVRSCLHR
jgi:hypothetical protein